MMEFFAQGNRTTVDGDEFSTDAPRPDIQVWVVEVDKPKPKEIALAFAEVECCLGSSWCRAKACAAFLGEFDREALIKDVVAPACNRVRPGKSFDFFAYPHPSESDCAHPFTERIARAALLGHQCIPGSMCNCAFRGNEHAVYSRDPGTLPRGEAFGPAWAGARPADLSPFRSGRPPENVLRRGRR